MTARRPALTLLCAVHKRRLYRQIADQLAALIAMGEVKPGERLPSERDLARKLRVSRSSLREGLISLEVAGKVEVRDGAGIFVSRAKPIALPVLFGEEQQPVEVLGARYIVEGEVAALAAAERTAADLVGIRRAFEVLRRAASSGRGSHSPDLAFHVAIAAATHNGALMALVRDLCGAEPQLPKGGSKNGTASSISRAALADYRRILEALEARDVAGARAAMRCHLKRAVHEGAPSGRPWNRSRRPLASSLRFAG